MELSLDGVSKAVSAVTGSVAETVGSVVRSGPGVVQGTMHAMNRLVNTVPVARDGGIG